MESLQKKNGSAFGNFSCFHMFFSKKMYNVFALKTLIFISIGDNNAELRLMWMVIVYR